MAKLAISRFHSCIIKFQRLDQELKWNELALPAGSLWGDPSVKNWPKSSESPVFLNQTLSKDQRCSLLIKRERKKFPPSSSPSASPSRPMELTSYTTTCCWPTILAHWHPRNVYTAELGDYACSLVCITLLAKDHSKKVVYFISSPLPLAKLPNLSLPHCHFYFGYQWALVPPLNTKQGFDNWSCPKICVLGFCCRLFTLFVCVRLKVLQVWAYPFSAPDR